MALPTDKPMHKMWVGYHPDPREFGTTGSRNSDAQFFQGEAQHMDIKRLQLPMLYTGGSDVTTDDWTFSDIKWMSVFPLCTNWDRNRAGPDPKPGTTYVENVGIWLNVFYIRSDTVYFQKINREAIGRHKLTALCDVLHLESGREFCVENNELTVTYPHTLTPDQASAVGKALKKGKRKIVAGGFCVLKAGEQATSHAIATSASGSGSGSGSGSSANSQAQAQVQAQAQAQAQAQTQAQAQAQTQAQVQAQAQSQAQTQAQSHTQAQVQAQAQSQAQSQAQTQVQAQAQAQFYEAKVRALTREVNRAKKQALVSEQMAAVLKVQADMADRRLHKDREKRAAAAAAEKKDRKKAKPTPPPFPTPPPPPDGGAVVQFAWQNDRGEWVHYAATENALLKAHAQAPEQAQAQSASPVTFKVNGNTYCVDLFQKTQTNVQTKVARPIQVSKAWPLRLLPTSDSFPSTWNMDRPRSHVFTQRLKKTDQAWKEVAAAFHATVPAGVTISGVEEVQNPELWEMYTLRRGQLEERDGGANEMQNVFHGCRGECVEGITLNGFVSEYNQVSVFGRGTYFARDALYSSNPHYSTPDQHGEQVMFSCCILRGEACRGNSNKKVPDPKRGTNTLCNSMVDDTRNPSIFVVQDLAAAYPRYIIRFTRHSVSV